MANTDTWRECSDCDRLLPPGKELAPHDCTGAAILDREYHEEKLT